jgi:hypothetical protein
VGVVGEQGIEAGALLVGEQVGPGVQGQAAVVERVALAATVAVDGLLDPAAALIERLAGRADHVVGVHHGGDLGQFLDRGGLEPGEAVHRHDLDALAPSIRTFGQPGLEGLSGASLDHVQQPGWAGAVVDGVRSMITVTYLSPLRVWRHTCSSTPITATPSNRVGSDQHALALGQDRVVGVFRPRRDSFARGCVALLVSCRHTCPQPLHR